MKKNRLAVASIALALVGLSACSDSPVAPSPATIVKPSFVISDTPPMTPVAGEVWVCKVWDGSVGNAPTVTVAENRPPIDILGDPNEPGPSPFLSITQPGTVVPGVCERIATSSSSNQDGNGIDEDYIDVTETPGAGSSFQSGKFFYTDRPAESFATASTSVVFNFFHGVVIVYENKVDPVGGCTYTKGWYQNKNGAPTIVETLDGRSPDDQRAIFAATPGKPGNVTWAGGNNTLNLYQQLLAALNNIAIPNPDLVPPTAVATAIANALAATGGSGQNITLIGNPDVGALITTLADFNEGKFAGFPHCE